jgi:hypothetical protein
MPFFRMAVVLVLTACGGGAAVGQETEAPRPRSGELESSRPPERSACAVAVHVGEAESHTSEYSYVGDVLQEVIVRDAHSGRTFTTRYAWEDADRTVRVEKHAQGDEPRRMVMRYEGSRADGEIVGEHMRDESLLERLTWHFDERRRPVRTEHEWLPTPEERADGRESRSESDVCIYDDDGRPTTYELNLEGELVLVVFYRYESDGRYPSSIIEKHIVPADIGARPNSIASVEMSPALRVTYPSEAEPRTTRYEGSCESVFFPAVCSTAGAPL